MPFSGFGREFYLLESDGSFSIVRYAPNAFANPPTWANSDDLPNLYSVIRPASTQGAVYILSDLDADSALDYDFTTGQQGWTAASDGGGVLAVYSAGNGWADNYPANADGIYIDSPAFAAGNLIRVSVYFSTAWGGAVPHISAVDTAQTVIYGETSSFGHTNIIFDCDGTSITQVRIIADPHVGSGQDFAGYITRILLYFGTGGVATRYSADYGATFASPESVGDAPGGFVGLDTQPVGSMALAGSAGQVKIATEGGAWSAYGTLMPAGGEPAAIVIPRYQFVGTLVPNAGTLPQYLVASDVLSAGGESMWRVTDGGETFTAISPDIGGTKGLAVSPNCIHMSWWTGAKMAAILDFDGTRHLMTTENAGGSWSDRGTLSENAAYIRYRKSDRQARQLFLADTVPVYSGDHGANLYPKAHPSPSGSLVDPILFVEPY